MVGNKDDLYLDQEVAFEEGLGLAKEIDAIYQRTSAKNESGGIDKLFEIIGKKLLNIDIISENSMSKKSRKLVNKNQKKNGKRRCCS